MAPPVSWSKTRREVSPNCSSANEPFGKKRLSVAIVRPAMFAELTWLPHPNLRVIPGVRMDYSSEVQSLTVDPRLSTRWSVTPETVLKAGVGRYSQAPDLGAGLPNLGNPNLRSSSSLHTSIGIEQRVGEHLQLGAEGYAVLRVTRVLPRDPAAGGGEAALRGQYAQALANAEATAYYESLKKRFKVSVTPPAAAASAP